MFQALKISQLGSALKDRSRSQVSYSAVLELGRIGTEKAVDLLIGALARRDGVARSAARELGRLRNERAIGPLVAQLGYEEVSQAAADALLAFGPQTIGPLLEVLKAGDGEARRAAAVILGELRDVRAVEPLVEVMQADDVYAVRTAAATALGQLKDARAVWVLVATLQLRDETTPERQGALEHLRHAATLALRKLGDPLAGKSAGGTAGSGKAAIEALKAQSKDAEIHPYLTTEIKLLNRQELAGVLKDLVAACEEVSWATLERREPMLPRYFDTYERRAKAADEVGREFYRRGGRALLDEVLEQDLAGYTAIANWWQRLGEHPFD